AVTPRVLRAPAVTPRDEEMRPSGTLQSPTTGSLEAMLRDADREEQLAAANMQRRNAAARPKPSFEPATITPAANNVGATQASNPTTNTPPVANVGTNVIATNNTPGFANPAAAAHANNSQVAKTQSSPEELPAFVPAPKSLVSNSEASQVAAVNTNLNTNAQVVLLTSSSRPVEAALTSVTANNKSAQLIMAPSDAVMRVRETRRFALELTSDASLAMAVLALRFNPKVIRIKGLSAGTQLAANNGNKVGAPGMTQSIDSTGVCLISLSNLHGAASLKDSGLWLFIDVEALSAGDAGLVFDKDATRFMATDASSVTLDLPAIHATVKQ
ncbi:MAG: hypothetical protein ABJB61_01160, partial [bacterium]